MSTSDAYAPPVGEWIEQGFGPFAAHQLVAVLALHSPKRSDAIRCVAAGADYDYHEHVEACFQQAVLCNGCGVQFDQCSTRRAAARGCPHAFDDGDAASPGDPCMWCDGSKPSASGDGATS